MSAPKKESARQELRRFTGSGRLRQALEVKLSAEALDLLVTVALRYCERSPRRRSDRTTKELGR